MSNRCSASRPKHEYLVPAWRGEMAGEGSAPFAVGGRAEEIQGTT